MSMLKTTLFAALLVAGLAASANAALIQQTSDGPREYGPAVQAGEWMKGVEAFASVRPALNSRARWQAVTTDRAAQETSIQ
jgi:hypothetical protein